jgi:broad specificity phosphatase PhoE
VRCSASRHAGERVAVFTHAGVVNQILGFLHGQSPARWENFRPHNTAITEVAWNRGTKRVICFDNRSHLETES